MKINGIEKSTASLQAYQSIFENMDRLKCPSFLASYFFFFAFPLFSEFFLVQFFSRVFLVQFFFTCFRLSRVYYFIHVCVYVFYFICVLFN